MRPCVSHVIQNGCNRGAAAPLADRRVVDPIGTGKTGYLEVRSKIRHDPSD